MSAGLNLRLVSDNVYNLVDELISDGDWNDTGRANKTVTVINTPLDSGELIEPNLVSVVMEDINHADVEIGSNLTDQRMTFVVDIIAENQSVGLHLAGDITAMFQSLYNFPVYDLTLATPTVLFYCDIEGVVQERNRMYESKYAKFWWVVSFVVERSAMADSL